MPGTVIGGDVWSPAPILDAVDRYRGTIFDLDTRQTFRADDFARAREALTRELRRQGLTPGDRVLVALPNGPLFIAALVGILACEASPLLVHAQTPSAELLRYARRFGIRFLATTATIEEVSHPSHVPTTIPFAPVSGLVWSRLDMNEAAPLGPLLKGVPMHPTSGSTGLPKIALRPGFAAMEEARHYATTMGIDQDDCLFAIPPLSHAYGYGTCVMLPLLTGADLVTTARFSVQSLSRVLADFPITVLPNVPANIDLLLFGGDVDYGRLRWMLAAGSMLPRRSAEKFRKKTGITVCPLYGTTETGGISVATTADGDDVDGRVGPAMEGVEVRVLRREENDGVDAEIGKLCVRSSSMMAGYLDERGQVTSSLESGWFETGDLARIVDAGVIHLRGRTGEMINVAGLKVMPSEVEEAIACLPGVREVKAYSSSRTSRVESVKVAVAVEAGVTEADIRAHCERNLVYYKRPRIVVIVAALPRSPAGKILPDQLP